MDKSSVSIQMDPSVIRPDGVAAEAHYDTQVKDFLKTFNLVKNVHYGLIYKKKIKIKSFLKVGMVTDLHNNILSSF